METFKNIFFIKMLPFNATWWQKSFFFYKTVEHILSKIRQFSWIVYIQILLIFYDWSWSWQEWSCPINSWRSSMFSEYFPILQFLTRQNMYSVTAWTMCIYTVLLVNIFIPNVWIQIWQDYIYRIINCISVHSTVVM